MDGLKLFNYWCYKVLPLVYDDSLSYYEVLCKVVNYINKLIEQDKVIGEDIAKLKEELQTVQSWIDNFDTSLVEELVDEYVASMIFVEITDAGYFVYYIPENWDNIAFKTTGLDINIPGEEFGRLVLSY